MLVVAVWEGLEDVQGGQAKVTRGCGEGALRRSNGQEVVGLGGRQAGKDGLAEQEALVFDQLPGWLARGPSS